MRVTLLLWLKQVVYVFTELEKYNVTYLTVVYLNLERFQSSQFHIVLHFTVLV